MPLTQQAQRYSRFLDHVREIRQLSSVESLLWWDQQTYMPQNGGENRARQLATIAKVLHRRKTEQSFVELTEALLEDSALGEDSLVNVREVWREVSRATLVPERLMGEIALAEADAHQRWIDARAADQFLVVRDALEKLIALKREYAAAIGCGRPLYDALLDIYEPGESAESIELLFVELGPRLRDLLDRIVDRAGISGRENPAHGRFPKAEQKQFCQEIMRLVGFDFESGRLDESVHPFCNGIGIRDVRITTCFDESDISGALMAVLHETGHGLYDQGLPQRDEHTPLAEPASLAIHESQSLLWEKQVGRSLDFWVYMYPLLQRAFPQAVGEVSLESYFRFVNQVKPSLIRVSADEVSYGLHVILRFELERQLIDGVLAVGDLPDAWNAKYEKYLGIRPPHEVSGVLQDSHWYGGAIGYFPTYLLGAMYSAQLFKAVEREHPTIREDVRRGNLLIIKRWLNDSIHAHGRRYSSRDLIQRATGEPPSAKPFLNYLEGKFGELYDL